MKILAFAGSNSSRSINKRLATYTAGLFDNTETEILDLNDFAMPLFSVDLEREITAHPLAQAFLDKIAAADMLVVSLAENNGVYSTAFKNIFDWSSRIHEAVFQQKPTLLMATSPGRRGGIRVLEFATGNLARYGMDVKATFSLPSFYENFDLEQQYIKHFDLDAELREKVRKFNAWEFE
jgi:NAD(P)H-dependent FMN reductase